LTASSFAVAAHVKSIETLYLSRTATLPSLTAPTRFAQLPACIPTGVRNTNKPIVAGCIAVSVAAALIDSSAANALPISALQCIVAASEVFNVGLWAALFTLVATLNRLTLVSGGAAVSILA
jgi:hypothetical protein